MTTVGGKRRMLNINVKPFYNDGNFELNSCSLGCNLTFEVDLKPVAFNTQQKVIIYLREKI